MLNISKNSIAKRINLSDFKSYDLLLKTQMPKLYLTILLVCLVLLLIGLFLPWTQNIGAKGYVTTRSPEQHPQAIQSVIAGRIDQWFIREGDYVSEGDTIVYITEIKSEYFDPDLLERTSEQLHAKDMSIEAYDEKILALQRQYKALEEALNLKQQQIKSKIQQAINKINIDSIDFVALSNTLKITENQYSRTKELYDKGLKSLSEMQDKEFKLQESRAKLSAQKNKWLNQKNSLIITRLELLAVQRDYAGKLSKSQSDLQSAISNRLESLALNSKLRSTLSGYNQRQKLYYITAPQDGYITKILKKGIGENIKEGSDIAIIVPADYDLAVEVYLQPNDLPLLSIGNRVRLRFDGWPAIVISGWPESSTGVFSGNIVAIDQFISNNGYYRVLISPDNTKKTWPEELRVGAGTQAFILLKDVPMWYEIWRKLNGFPPEFYTIKGSDKNELKRKVPLKSVK
ncbi:HlyD family secretion protein [Carboxylicivirga sp. N1Y90]|uniref:HlyD family secretion protein n=1 Tax=Carboxylicivirga fragile TaxID=3417571 RepID=UPI003D340BD7|nr:HlyD family efflux transporter periplasmic adaptor subunit [Marinilabiliaceae bacterium N1Y90]